MAPSRTPFVCIRCARTMQLHTQSHISRAFSNSSVQRSTPDTLSEELPRWRQTPATMRMPYRLRPKPNQPEWTVNKEQETLDEMYDRFVGRAGEATKGQRQTARGRDMLPEEIKWVAVTHKSFDHARQGFNDRLAFLGKRIVDLQTSVALLNAPPPPASRTPNAHADVYQHEALQGLENITAHAKTNVLDRSRLAQLASSYGIDRVMRWKPKKSDNLKGSGVETVLAHTMYSIIGALALQRGGDVAVKVVRERILQPLGLR